METNGLFWIAVVAIPTIVYAAGDAFNRWMKFKEKMLSEAARQAATEAARHVATIERLEQRTSVLERIVTDKGVETAAQIEKLRNAPLN
jgi:acyl-CoA reductase-like NAD-dependent aldehyde dehydrogenase